MQLKISFRISNYNKRHDTLLHKDTSSKTDGIQHNSFNKFLNNKTFLQIVLVMISNKNHLVHTKTFFDSGSNATLPAKDVAGRLELTGTINNYQCYVSKKHQNWILN